MEQKEDTLIIKTGDDIDPRELAGKIRQRVKQKMESGYYDKAEIDWVSNLNPQIPGAVVDSGRDQLRELNETWNVGELDSPGGGLAGKIKNFLHKLNRISLHKQVRFNIAVKNLIEEVFNLRTKHLLISERLQNMDERLAQIESDHVKANAERAELKDSVERLELSLRDVDKQGIFLKRRITGLLDKVKNGSGGTELAEAASVERSKMDSFDYSLFENLHRGSREEIKERLKVYMDWFDADGPVLDIGCGRGEMLELFSEKGIGATGVDINEEAVTECCDRGLVAVEKDALTYLESADDGSLGGISAIQFVEHLPVEVMTRFFELAHQKLKPGAVIAAETVNAACLTTFCSAFYLDLSHIKPIHPLALQFLLERLGYEEVRIEYLNPYPEDIRLAPLPDKTVAGGLDERVVAEYNQNVMKLNNVLYSHADYAVVARR